MRVGRDHSLRLACLWMYIKHVRMLRTNKQASKQGTHSQGMSLHCERVSSLSVPLSDLRILRDLIDRLAQDTARVTRALTARFRVVVEF